MFTTTATNSSLWKSAFIDPTADTDQAQRLVSSLSVMRSKVDQLSSMIRADFPDLTAHDITHLDALWEVGSTICGLTYPINPLEGFILGASILLHDIALSFAAYEGGAERLRKTTTWKDNYSLYLGRNEKNDKAIARKNADFATIRLFHANECRELATREWRRGKNNAEYLIDDPHLRNHYGELIGAIAASHHWGIDNVASQFSEQINPTGELPSSWVVHPIKIACILRCADAGHIDGRRAPDFLLSVLARNKVSQDHWIAQNYLSRLCEHQADRSGQTLSINSTRPFRATEAAAWWVAKEAIDVLSREIQQCNDILTKYDRLNSPPFGRQSVYGAQNIRSLATVIKTLGWHPTEAQVKIGDVESVVTQLGGRNLYDRQTEFGVVLRELIQNARDAICARQTLEPSYRTGAVRVSLQKEDNTWVLNVEDNGIGMSESTMTGHLLDFGSSFWRSQVVQSEWPGLLSSDFRSSGMFGIGFFSVFMVADSVTISSRRFSSDITSFRTLDFQSGMTLRPLLSSSLPEEATTNLSTRVRVRINDGHIDESGNVVLKSFIADNEKGVPFLDFLAATVALIDVPVIFVDRDKSEIELKRMPDQSVDNDRMLEWLSSLNAHRSDKVIDRLIDVERDLTRMRCIYDNGKKVGLAALRVSSGDYRYSPIGMIAISGLSSLDDGLTNTIIGGVSVPPSGAARRALAHHWPSGIERDSIEPWVTEQIRLLAQKDIPLEDIQETIETVTSWGYDAYPIWKENLFVAGGIAQRVKNSDLVNFIGGREVLFNVNIRFSENKFHVDAHAKVGPSSYKRNFSGELLYMASNFYMMGSSYWEADYSNPNLANLNTLIGHFERHIRSEGHRTHWEKIKKTIIDEDEVGRELDFLRLSIDWT